MEKPKWDIIGTVSLLSSWRKSIFACAEEPFTVSDRTNFRVIWQYLCFKFITSQLQSHLKRKKNSQHYLRFVEWSMPKIKKYNASLFNYILENRLGPERFSFWVYLLLTWLTISHAEFLWQDDCDHFCSKIVAWHLHFFFTGWEFLLNWAYTLDLLR